MPLITKDHPSYKKTTFALFAGSFATFASVYSVQPLFPILSDQFHVSAAAASMTLSVTTAMLAIFLIAASMLSDTIGRRPVMVVSVFATSVLTILTAFSPNLTFLLVIRALLGVSIAGFPSIAMTFINEEFDSGINGSVMGLYVSGATFGGLSARVVVGALADWFSWHVALGLIGIACLLIGIWLWRNIPDAKQFRAQKVQLRYIIPALGRHIINPALLCLFLIGFVLRGSFDTLYNYISYPLMEPPYNLSQTFVGFIFLVYLAGTFSSAFMGRTADRIGKGKAILASILIMLAGAVLTLHGNLWVILMGAAIYTAGFFAAHAIASGWVGMSATHDQSLASSGYLIFYYLGSSTIGPFGGVFLDKYGWSGVIGIISIFISISLASAILLSSIRLRKRLKE